MPPRFKNPNEKQFKTPEIPTAREVSEKQTISKPTEQIVREEKEKKIALTKRKIEELTRMQVLRASIGENAGNPDESERIARELKEAEQEAEKLEGSQSEVDTKPVTGRRILLQEDIDRSKKESAELAAEPVLALYDKLREVEKKIRERPSGEYTSLNDLLTEKFALLKGVEKLDPEKKAIYFFNEEFHKAEDEINKLLALQSMPEDQFNKTYGEMADDVRKWIPDHIKKNNILMEEHKHARDELIKKLSY